jgi:hypothetical protein
MKIVISPEHVMLDQTVFGLTHVLIYEKGNQKTTYSLRNVNSLKFLDPKDAPIELRSKLQIILDNRL